MYEHANLLARRTSVFATSPPLISSSLHILTTLSHSAVVAPAVQYFLLPSVPELIPPSEPAFEALPKPKAEPELALVVYPAQTRKVSCLVIQVDKFNREAKQKTDFTLHL